MDRGFNQFAGVALSGNFIIEQQDGNNSKMIKKQSTSNSMPVNSLLAQQQLLYINALKNGVLVQPQVEHRSAVKQTLAAQQKSQVDIGLTSPGKIITTRQGSRATLSMNKN
jgi:hypothetical protein